mgnify:CR=1 FL=1
MTQSDLELKRQLYSLALHDGLRRIVASLIQIPEVELVVVFGSYVRNRRDLFTDLDLLIVMESDKGFVERVADLHGRIGSGVDVDYFVYTPSEFERLRHTRFIRHALGTGETLYEKRGD